MSSCIRWFLNLDGSVGDLQHATAIYRFGLFEALFCVRRLAPIYSKCYYRVSCFSFLSPSEPLKLQLMALIMVNKSFTDIDQV